jgi:hypothetical protein
LRQSFRKGADDFARIRAVRAFPKSLLHPAIANKVHSSLMRGDLDDAVFAAFKAVEVAVREAGNYKTSDIGVPLMRKGFDAKKRTLDIPVTAWGEGGALPFVRRGDRFLQEAALPSNGQLE